MSPYLLLIKVSLSQPTDSNVSSALSLLVGFVRVGVGDGAGSRKQAEALLLEKEFIKTC